MMPRPVRPRAWSSRASFLRSDCSMMGDRTSEQRFVDQGFRAFLIRGCGHGAPRRGWKTSTAIRIPWEDSIVSIFRFTARGLTSKGSLRPRRGCCRPELARRITTRYGREPALNRWQWSFEKETLPPDCLRSRSTAMGDKWGYWTTCSLHLRLIARERSYFPTAPAFREGLEGYGAHVPTGPEAWSPCEINSFPGKRASTASTSFST